MGRFRSTGRLLHQHLVLLAGTLMAGCFAAMVTLPVLRGPPLTRFVVYFMCASGAYAIAVAWLDRAPPSLRLIWLLAVLFRLTLLATSPPTLSDDVYRYTWDGRLANAGVNPYSHAVDSPLLDRFDSPERALVNNAWMASPYLPVAQLFFAAIYRLAPAEPLAFQIAAVLFDLLTGLLIMDLLRRLHFPRQLVLIYLWNPLVVVEFAHGAHVDALMVCLMLLALWGLVREGGTKKERRRKRLVSLLSPLALAAATLTKGLPALLLPVVTWRWGWRRTLLYGGLLVAALVPLALEAGWGLTGPRNGEGLFGALRIYAARWNYNGGLYHWLEVALSGYRTPGAVPPEVVGQAPIRTAKLIMTAMLGLVLIAVGWKGQHHTGALALLRLALVPLGAYLVLTTTVHPWYVTIVIPLLPFLKPTRQREKGDGVAPDERRTRENGKTTAHRYLWPWLYFSVAVALSYLTYLDPANLREYDRVRLLEYLPFYLLLLWAAWPAIGGADEPGAD